MSGITSEMLLGLLVVAGCFEEYGRTCIVTSGVEGDHGETSLHYVGDALDFRTKHLEHHEKTGVVELAIMRLTEEYDVVLEDEEGRNEHLHVEFDRKKVRRG